LSDSSITVVDGVATATYANVDDTNDKKLAIILGIVIPSVISNKYLII
jgi:hypothetical protein